MIKVLKIDKEIKNQLVLIHQLPVEVTKMCESMGFCDRILEVSSDVFIKVCANSGKLWVSSSGNNRLMLMHARVFEESIKEKSRLPDNV